MCGRELGIIMVTGSIFVGIAIGALIDGNFASKYEYSEQQRKYLERQLSYGQDADAEQWEISKTVLPSDPSIVMRCADLNGIGGFAMMDCIHAQIKKKYGEACWHDMNGKVMTHKEALATNLDDPSCKNDIEYFMIFCYRPTICTNNPS